MKRIFLLAPACVAAQAVLLGFVGAEETSTQIKTGIVKTVDTTANYVVVIVTRELTFTVTESTKIVRNGKAASLAAVMVGARVTVEYTREGDTRTAKKIEIRAPEAAGGHAAKGADPEIKPGGTFTIKFPDLPPTLAEVLDHSGVNAQMTVFLPTNYDESRKHPLLILLSGGNGGTAGNPSVARALSEDKDFVCVSLPLFKEKVDPPGPDNHMARILIRNPDCRFAWPLYKKMLAKLDQMVPNLDPAHQILGGFSNGAHATSGLIDESEGEVTRRFSAFLFVEGGGKLQHYDLLKDKPFLMVSSNAKSQPRAQQICDAAKAAGAKATLVVEDVGAHGFPVSAYPAVRAWLRGAAME